MATQLFNVFLAIVALAATAAGFVISEYAVPLWIAAAVFGVATVIVWLWERRKRTPSAKPTSAHVNASGDATVIRSGRDIMIRGGDGGPGGAGGSVMFRGGDAGPAIPPPSVNSMAPIVDAQLTATVLAVRPYVEPRRIIGPGMASPVAGIEYTNESPSALRECAITWEELAIPASNGWTKIDWFVRHRLTWDDTGKQEARFAARQSRRVELVTRWPGSAVASVKFPGDPGDGYILPYGSMQATLSVVVDGYRARKEKYDLYWSEDGELSIDQSGDLIT